MSEFWHGQRYIKLLDPNLLACPDHLELIGQLAAIGAWVDFTQGLDARLITHRNAEAQAKVKTKMIHFALDDMPQMDAVARGLQIYAQHKQMSPRERRVYILTNFNTTHDQDMERVRLVQSLGYWPYVMIYNKPSAPQITRDLQRWSNSPYIYFATQKFEDYKPREKGGKNETTDKKGF